MIKKIVTIGPESTGKSTLCQQLASHYNTIWVKEFAREYLFNNGMNYTFETLLDIAKGQLASEDETIKKWETENRQSININNQPVFIDTDMNVMKVWSEFVFEKSHNWVLNQVVERKYDLYLLCNTDLPWVKDELREYPDLEEREKLYHHYKDLLINQHMPWVEISGGFNDRLNKAIAAVNNII